MHSYYRGGVFNPNNWDDEAVIGVGLLVFPILSFAGGYILGIILRGLL